MATAVLSPARISRLPRPVQLWHLCSLDAPTIAAVWCAAIAVQLGVALPASVLAALFATVWMVYVLDRLLGSRSDAPQDDCHGFHHRHRGTLYIILAVALVAIFASITAAAMHGCGRSPLWASGVLPLLGVYFMYEHSVQHSRSRRTWGRIKPWCIALLFSAGVTLPVAALSPHSRASLPLFAAFAVLIRLNLFAISGARHGRATLPPQPAPDVERWVIAWGAVLAMLSAAGFWPLALGAALLLIAFATAVKDVAALDRRIVPDLVLLAPVFILLRHALVQPR